MQISTMSLTAVRSALRKILRLKPRDRVVLRIIDHEAVISKAQASDRRYYSGLSKTLVKEWDSPEDNDAYNNL